MEPYRVLLADDEEEIRVGISRKIDWAGLGVVLVGEAENGAEALELAEQLRPDVVLTDIKMPFMDGLELCRREGVDFLLAVGGAHRVNHPFAVLVVGPVHIHEGNRPDLAVDDAQAHRVASGIRKEQAFRLLRK